MGAKLPKWLTHQKDGTFLVDPDIAFPIVLKGLGVKDADVDTYWVETALQCTKIAVQEMILGSDLDPRPKGMALTIVIGSSITHKENWAHVNHKVGRNPIFASKGLEAKKNYPKVAALLRA